MAASTAVSPASTQQKPRLSFWQIWNMSFGFLGIQFGFELQNNNISRIFETLGANKDDIPILWIAAPLTGLVVQPIIGYFSDRTWHPYWGRRRPFFLIGAVLATLALIIMPNSSVLWMAGSMLWILDASINISMEPFRAFVGDKLPSEQRTAGFAMQSFFIGVGSVIAALLPWVFTNWFHLSNTAASGEIPPSVKWSFYFGAGAFLLAQLVLQAALVEARLDLTQAAGRESHVVDHAGAARWHRAIGVDVQDGPAVGVQPGAGEAQVGPRPARQAEHADVEVEGARQVLGDDGEVVHAVDHQDSPGGLSAAWRFR